MRESVTLTLTLHAGRLVCGLVAVNIEIGFGWLKRMIRTFIEVSGVHREQVVASLAPWIVSFGHDLILAPNAAQETACPATT